MYKHFYRKRIAKHLIENLCFKLIPEKPFKVLIVYFVFILTSASFAGKKNISFKHLTINDGLSQNAVFAILQDSKGFMWFGTKDGLNRYDGYNFTVYYHNPFDTTSISSNYITILFEDSRGLIWIGTIGGGVSVYQYKTGKFKRLKLNTIDGLFGDTRISSIAEDKDSNIWIGTTSNGLFKLEITNSNKILYRYKQYLSDSNSTPSLGNNDITSLLVDSEGTLWIGTLTNLIRFNTNNNSFKKIKVLTKNSKAPRDIIENGITSIYEDRNKRLWLGTLSGLVLYNKKSGKYKLFPHHFNVYRFGWGAINDIIEDNSGNLWLATPAELMIFNPGNKSYEYFRHNPFNSKSLSFNTVVNFWMDRTGNLWIGTSGGGINIYDQKANRFETVKRENNLISRISGFSVRSIFEDRKGFVWISGDVLYRWDRKSGKLKSYEADSEYLNRFGNTGAYSIIQSSSGYIWFATTQGLYRYNPIKETTKHFKYNLSNKLGLPQREVYSIFEDDQLNIWVLTENYICKLIDTEKGYFKKIKYINLTQTNERVRPVVCQDGKQRFWIGTKDGLLKFNREDNSFIIYRNDPSVPTSLNSNLIKSLCPDPNDPENILWIGTAGGGLNRFDIERNIFTYFMEKDGLPNNVVYGILPDENGNLWLSTNKGLSQFNVTSKSFRNFNISDGLQSNEFNTGAYFKSKKGEMFFGGINGVNYFYPNKIKSNPFKPTIVMTDFKVLSKQQISSKNNIFLGKPASEIDSIILSYDEDIIQFEFAALDYSAPEKNQYAYKLEGFNKDWIYSGSKRTATFTNLSPGEYVFHVKGSNNDGIWNEKGTSVKLLITPPWWNSWWAYGGYLVLTVMILYLIRKYELNRIFLKNQLDIEIVKSVTLSNLDHLKSRFFANISHEFRTPLTLILGQIDNVMDSGITPKEKGKLQVAKKNAKRLLILINQLLDLSKLEAGSMKLHTKKNNLVTFLKSLFFSFESIAEVKHIALEFDCEHEDINVLFDPDRMEKVFFNLISNSLKFTNNGGQITVSVMLSNSNEEFNYNGKGKLSQKNKNDLVKIVVKDTGIGIPGNRIEHIFDRFYQVDGSRTRDYEGTGIGLALAKELVELHKGKIEVKSEVNVGSEFIVYLPFDNAQNYPEKNIDKKLYTLDYNQVNDLINNDITNQEILTEDQDSGSMNKKTEKKKIIDRIILIVEDHPHIRSYIKEQLESKYRIVEAENGEVGLEKSFELIPDLIISDVMMPKLDGYQFCKKIKQDEKTSHIPVVMLTAKASIDNKIEGLETGADAYITKPFSSKELAVRVDSLIYQREQLRKKFSKATVIKPSEISVTSVDQLFMNKVIEYIESNFENDQFGVSILAGEVNMSISQLNRKLKALVDQPAGQLIRSMRLKRAADLLKQNAGSVAEVCYMVGFNDQSYFTRTFKNQFGQTPSEYKKIP
ncbi:sensor histidine kinase TodS [bacterium BMS3Abin04]|nr:sensor histidine kinase TodS [bacterium BMS3Abin04]